MKTYTFHSDAGHAWLEVDRKELNELGIADKISTYSYEKDNKVFLEEDCDVPQFITSLKQNDIKFQFVEVYKRNSPIRNYSPYYKQVLTQY